MDDDDDDDDEDDDNLFSKCKIFFFFFFFFCRERIPGQLHSKRTSDQHRDLHVAVQSRVKLSNSSGEK